VPAASAVPEAAAPEASAPEASAPVSLVPAAAAPEAAACVSVDRFFCRGAPLSNSRMRTSLRSMIASYFLASRCSHDLGMSLPSAASVISELMIGSVAGVPEGA